MLFYTCNRKNILLERTARCLQVFWRAPVYMLMTVMLEKWKQRWDFSPHRPLLTIQAALGWWNTVLSLRSVLLLLLRPPPLLQPLSLSRQLSWSRDAPSGLGGNSSARDQPGSLRPHHGLLLKIYGKVRIFYPCSGSNGRLCVITSISHNTDE